MSEQSLEQVLQSTGNTVKMLRGGQTKPFPGVSNEYTHWIEEQRSWQESCSLADQSHHMTDLWVEGPDALEVFTDLGINSFESFEVGQAKQFVACNPDGYVIGDGILFHLSENKFDLVGRPPSINWVQYNCEFGDYDVSIERDDSSAVRDGPPKQFRYQIQGPNALEVMEKVTKNSLPDLPFFHFTDMVIDGNQIRALRHTMAGEPGFEFWGSWEDADEVREAVLEAGQEYGIRRLGTKSYVSSAAISGWVADPLPAVYGEEMGRYREWLDEDSFEAVASIGGSFVSNDITDYYLTPTEIGYGPLISFDHDFVGREALQERENESGRRLVTLVWDDEDVIDVYRSLFEKGDTYKFMNLPTLWWAAMHYDEVLKGDNTVGISKFVAYHYNQREIISLCCIDEELSEPGTEVSLVWGEPENSNPAVESHVQKEIQATVARAPYIEDRR